MGNESWTSTRLGTVVSLQRGYDLPESMREPGKIPVVGSAGTTGFHSKARVSGPGVTIGRSGVGSIGVVTYCDFDYWPHNTVLFVTDFHGNDPRFCYYLLHSLDLRRLNSGSAQASLNRNYVHELVVTIPSPIEQARISHLLGVLDDKIELNHRLNATLEAMARAIFQSWFVDFDPVHAKARGEQPLGMDAEIAALFPDSFEDSELGMIPAGWQAASLKQIISERNERNRSGNWWRVVSAVSSGELVLSDQFFNKRVYSDDTKGYKRVYPFDFAYNPSRINIGSIGMLKDFDHGLVSPVYGVFDVEDDYELIQTFRANK